MKKLTGYILLILFFALLWFGGWKLERWINWKFSYGNKVETRIEQLETRIEQLESGG